MLQKVSVYPVSFPNRLRRKERLFYLGFSRYIPAAGQAEPKQALSSQGNDFVGLRGSLGYAALLFLSMCPRLLNIPCRGRTDGSNHSPSSALPYCSLQALRVCFAGKRWHDRVEAGSLELGVSLTFCPTCVTRGWGFPSHGPQHL